MDYSIFLGEIQEDYNNLDIMIQKIDIYIESMYREYMINREESELKVMTESGTDDDLTFLYEEAQKSFSEKASRTMKKIIDSVSTFVNKVITTIKEKYANSKLNFDLDKLEQRLKSDKSLGNRIISIVDIDSIKRCYNEAIDKCHTIASKIKNNIENEKLEILDKINEEINSIDDFYQKKKKEIGNKRKEINLKEAISYFRSKIKSCIKEKFNANIFISISDKMSSLKEKLLLKLNAKISHFCKSVWSFMFSCLNDGIKQIREEIKSKKKKSTNVEQESTLENFDNDEIYEENEERNEMMIANNLDLIYEDAFDDVFDSVYLESYATYGGDIDSAFPLIDYFGEGANLDAQKYYKQFRRDYKVNLKKIKELTKAKKYKEAKRYIKDTRKLIKETTNMVKSCDSTAGSFVFGLYTSWVPTFKRDLLLCLIPFVGIGIVQIMRIVEAIQGILNSINDSSKEGKPISIDNFNLYKNALLTRLNVFDKSLDKFEKLCDESEKVKDDIKDAKKDVKKESVEDDFFDAISL